MPKVKLPRKSTNIDMTAMCDVAFLLLAFFILTTKFKPAEALSVTTPKSVSSEAVKAEDVVLVTMDDKGKLYFSVSDENTEEKKEIIDVVDQLRNLGLTEAEKAAFVKPGSYVGVPFNKLKGYLGLTPEQIKAYEQEGIPVQDTLDNQMVTWIRAAKTAFQGQKMNVMVKGDNNAKFPSFKGVNDALKKNDELKFQIITDPEGVPPGTELYRLQGARKPAE